MGAHTKECSDSRARFEKAMAKIGQYHYFTRVGENYRSYETQLAWRVWQEAERQAAERFLRRVTDVPPEYYLNK
jgi:hypothetical protein